MASELFDALDRADTDDDVRVIVFTGAGRAFSAGADLSGGIEGFDFSGGENQKEGPDFGRDFTGKLALRVFDCKKPTIAATSPATWKTPLR